MNEADFLIASWASAAAPPPALTVSEWAEENRVLPETSGAQGGHWHNASAPYLVGIMDAVHEPGVKTIAVEKGAQLGGSEVLNNILGYFIEHDPCPILYVLPTFGDVEEWSKQRLADMIRRTPALAAVVRDKRQPRGSHEAESTLNLKIYPGGYLALGGANTPNTFARRAVRIAIGDDVDRFPPVVGEEGDPADLLEKRTTTFYDSLVMFVSTPTLKGGRIDTLYARSDQRRFFVACPHCGREDWITWNDPNHFRVTFEGDDPMTAWLACPDQEHGGCGALMSEPERRQMIAAAAKRKDKGWRPTATPKQPGLVGFHVPGMVSTLGITLEGLVGEWQAARAKGKESLKVFINTRLAEGWEDRTARQSPDPLYARRESYGEGIEVPAAAAALTAGVDVQENRFELLVTAWGPAEERWVVERREIPGRPERDAAVWPALLQALRRKYRHASGHQLPIHATCIDSGFATEQVYSFVLAHQARRIYATKGIAGRGGEPIVGKPTEKRHGKSPLPVRLWPINVDDAKANVFGSLNLAAPGPGYVHFPMDLDEEFFAQLCAEHKETRYNAAGVATHVVWVQDRERNEVLDMSVLCLAAFRLLRPNVLQMLEVLATTPVPVSPAAPARAPSPVPGPARPPDAGRRVSHSSYLGR
jgi:phage terminase large subunit GpA-like protein